MTKCWVSFSWIMLRGSRQRPDILSIPPAVENLQQQSIKPCTFMHCVQYQYHRKRIYTEEKAKVVTAAWGQNLFISWTGQFEE